MKGAYVLILKMDNDKEIQIGKLAKFQFKEGFYAYVGSALRGFGRIDRHFNVAKGLNTTRKWHVDYLLPHSRVDCAVLVPTEEKIECDISMTLKEHLKEKNLKDTSTIISGFGCTDCYCITHLYYDKDELRKIVTDVCKRFGKILIRQYK